MQGDHRVRHCSECNLNVYNFSAMPEREIQRLLLAKNERLCARWYRRSDGTILTSDCPVGFRARIKKISLVAGSALSTLLSLSPAAAQTTGRASASTANSIENSESGVIVVRVADETGAVIPKATVTLLDSLNKAVAKGETDNSGEFRAEILRSGSYSVQVGFPGFEKSETHGILMEPNKTVGTTVLIRLGVAVMGEVVVTGGNSVELERGGDVPVLLPLAQAPDAAPATKPTTIRRLFSKIKGNTK
jgi:hypothetical protein